MKTTTYTFIISSCLIIGATVTVRAQAGSLDLTFGSDGKVTTSVGICDDLIFSIAVQSDGKIVAAGISPKCLYYYNPDNDFALVRYNSDGGLDNTLDSDGIVTTDFGNDYNDAGYSVAIQADGKIVVGGTSYNGANYDFALVRYNSDGSLDTTFDSDGKVTTAIGNFDELGSKIAIQSDGKILLAGYTYNGSDYDIALVRYNSDGSLDTTFDSDGIVTTAIGNGDDVGFSQVIQSDGKIVVSGYSNNSANADFAVVRYNSDGSLDNTFGSDGKVTTGFTSSTDIANSVTIQTDGKIVVVGPTYDGVNEDFALARYNTDGSLDNTFGLNGKLTTSFGNGYDFGTSVAIQENGKIVAAGWGFNPLKFDFVLARYNKDGSLDNTFDNDGKVTTDFGNSTDQALTIAIQSDDKIVAAGTSGNSGPGYDFAIARYNSETEVGIAENIEEENVIHLSPNPVQTQLTIDLSTPANETTISVYDLQGGIVSVPTTFSNRQAQINTITLADGFYILQVCNNKTGVCEVRKFVKQH